MPIDTYNKNKPFSPYNKPSDCIKKTTAEGELATLSRERKIAEFLFGQGNSSDKTTSTPRTPIVTPAHTRRVLALGDEGYITETELFTGATPKLPGIAPTVNGKPHSQLNKPETGPNLPPLTQKGGNSAKPKSFVHLKKDKNGAYLPENVNKSSSNLSGSSTPSDASFSDSYSNSSDSTNGLSSSTTPNSGCIVPTPPPKRKPC